METRHRYRIIIGIENAILLQLFAAEIGRRLTEKFGGCTILEGQGFWAENGNEDLDRNYTGIMQEPSRAIEVVTKYPSDYTIPIIVQEAADSFHEWDSPNVEGKPLSKQWVHFEHERIEVDHFQIQ